MPAPWVLPVAIAAGQALISSFSNWRARKINENYVRKQNEYNSPRSQMARYQAAGLNPALIYSQGNPGNQAQALTVPYHNVASEAVNAFNQSRLASSQIQAQQANVRRTDVLAEVGKLQAEVLRKNPYLNERSYDAIIDSFISTARSKAAQAGIDTTTSDWFTGVKSFTTTLPDGTIVERTAPAGVQKMEKELETLFQRYDLANQDKEIKAQILESKQFDNDLKELQRNWLKDGEITWGQLFEIVKIFLMKIK